MPKEIINNAWYGQSAESIQYDDKGVETGRVPVAIDDSGVKVGWQRGGNQLDVAIIHHRDGGTDEGTVDWHSQLDRAGVNRLIRALRKARDQAFGSDA